VALGGTPTGLKRAYNRLLGGADGRKDSDLQVALHVDGAMAAEAIVSMNGWGINPATIQAIAAAVTALSVFFVWLSFRETQSSRRVMETEIANRQRPWLRIDALAFDAAPKGSADQDKLRVDATNVGQVPAEGVRLELNFELLKRGEVPNPINWTDEVKTFVQGEKRGFYVPITSYPQFVTWRSRKQEIFVNGRLKYSRAQTAHETTISAVIYFVGEEVGIRWSHEAAN
jgi:hypothetical protein